MARYPHIHLTVRAALKVDNPKTPLASCILCALHPHEGVGSMLQDWCESDVSVMANLYLRDIILTDPPRPSGLYHPGTRPGLSGPLIPIQQHSRKHVKYHLYIYLLLVHFSQHNNVDPRVFQTEYRSCNPGNWVGYMESSTWTSQGCRFLRLKKRL